ncbi:MAG: putative DNA modification/repair radical SAM protein [Clostridiales bacterium]|jgi:putative DNA modification/repair radical SAM protein|nr:putative DNA modification/repair radical SAM protein [Clostridiales bacterium]
MTVEQKVGILSDGAKYDVSCSSSGSARAAKSGSLGSAAVGGICHSFTSDGRCVSLLKILMTNNCAYDCLYCVNRRSNDIPRASLAPREIAELTYGMYRRNYIEGLFLSSAIEHSPDRTMELLCETVRILREELGFGGYIHLKGIPHADPAIISRAAALADRMSVNIELPTENGLKLLAPAKTKDSILKPLSQLAEIYAEGQLDRYNPNRALPAGTTTQLIIGATPDSDATIIRLSEGLYRRFGLKRVYYSAYMPLGTSPLLPAVRAPLLREHRLYQADWLLRFYGFSADEILPENTNLNTELDPKSDWAVRNPHLFPIEVNTAPYEMLLRTPGIGPRGAWRIREARAHARLSYEDLKRMRVVLKRARHFITVGGKFYGHTPELTLDTLRALDAPPPAQLSMFDTPTFLPLLTAAPEEIAASVITGEM